MKRRILGVPVGALLLSVAACGSPAAPGGGDPAGVVISTPQEVTLKLGEELPVGGTVLYVGFQQVLEDSRCPVDVVCVQAGNALVGLGIHMGMGPTHELRVNTGAEPRAAKWNDLLVTLVSLDPLPKAGQPTDALPYVVRLRVEPAPGTR